MPPQGLYKGLARPGWQEFTPELRGFGNAPVQPVLGNAVGYGRYLVKPSGLVTYQGGITFGSSTSFGSGEWIWGVRLPLPANRSSGGADLPIGNAWAWQGTGAAPQINVPLTPTLMDPITAGGGSQGAEDYWAQFFLPWLIATGTGTITSGNTFVDVTHGLAAWTPAAYDIQIVPTATTTNNCLPFYVDNLDGDSFRVNVKSNPGASGFAFSWKIRGEPNNSATFDLLANHQRPFVWAAGHTLAWNLTYEARR